MHHAKLTSKDKLEKKVIALEARLNELYKESRTQEVPVEEPYHDGYYFELHLKPKYQYTALSDTLKESLDFILDKSLVRFHREKHPEFLKTYDVFTDRWKAEKSRWHGQILIDNGFFPSFEERYFEKNVPEKFRSLFVLRECTVEAFFGSTETKWVWVVNSLWRDYFQIHRRKRIITHRQTVIGELESEIKKLGELLYTQKLSAMYRVKHWKDDDWWYEGKKKRDIVRAPKVDD